MGEGCEEWRQDVANAFSQASLAGQSPDSASSGSTGRRHTLSLLRNSARNQHEKKVLSLSTAATSLRKSQQSNNSTDCETTSLGANAQSTRATESKPSQTSESKPPQTSESKPPQPHSMLTLMSMARTAQRRSLPSHVHLSLRLRPKKPQPQPSPTDDQMRSDDSQKKQQNSDADGSTSIDPSDEVNAPPRLQEPKQEPVEENEKFTCAICNRDLTTYNEIRRAQHMNRCCDAIVQQAHEEMRKREAERRAATPESLYGEFYTCPLCKKDLSKFYVAGRINHLKTCSSKSSADAQKRSTSTTVPLEIHDLESGAVTSGFFVQPQSTASKPSAKEPQAHSESCGPSTSVLASIMEQSPKRVDNRPQRVRQPSTDKRNSSSSHSRRRSAFRAAGDVGDEEEQLQLAMALSLSEQDAHHDLAGFSIAEDEEPCEVSMANVIVGNAGDLANQRAPVLQASKLASKYSSKYNGVDTSSQPVLQKLTQDIVYHTERGNEMLWYDSSQSLSQSSTPPNSTQALNELAAELALDDSGKTSTPVSPRLKKYIVAPNRPLATSTPTLDHVTQASPVVLKDTTPLSGSNRVLDSTGNSSRTESYESLKTEFVETIRRLRREFFSHMAVQQAFSSTPTSNAPEKSRVRLEQTYFERWLEVFDLDAKEALEPSNLILESPSPAYKRKALQYERQHMLDSLDMLDHSSLSEFETPKKKRKSENEVGDDPSSEEQALSGAEEDSPRLVDLRAYMQWPDSDTGDNPLIGSDTTSSPSQPKNSGATTNLSILSQYKFVQKR